MIEKGHKDDAYAMFCVFILEKACSKFDLSEALGSNMWSLIGSSWVHGSLVLKADWNTNVSEF